MGYYFFFLNAIISVGILSSADVPTIIQRLGAKIGKNQIGVASWLVVKGRWPFAVAMAAFSSTLILWFDTSELFTTLSLLTLVVGGLLFALTLSLTETLLIFRGSIHYEIQRSIVRPLFTVAFVALGITPSLGVFVSVVGAFLVVIIANLGALKGISRVAPLDIAKISSYAKERSVDANSVILLSLIGTFFSSMDVVIFALVNDLEKTGVYGAASRYAMLINVAVLAGNAQMTLSVARVAASERERLSSIADLKNKVRLVRFAVTGLLLTIASLLSVYARIVNIPVFDLLPFFIIIAVSCWFQGMLGPCNLVMLHTHQINRLIYYNLFGLILFVLISVWLHHAGVAWAIPMGAAVGTTTVKLLSWRRIRYFNGVIY